MLKKHKVVILLSIILLLTNSVSAKLLSGKKVLLGAGGLLAAGYTICKAAKYGPYFEIPSIFDAKTNDLLSKIEAKYSTQIVQLDGYNYQPSLVQAQIDEDIAKAIFTKHDLCAYLEEFQVLQAELDLRLSRLSSWYNTRYLYGKWNDLLTDASVNMYNLQLWLEQAQLPLRAKVHALQLKYEAELNNLDQPDAIIEIVKRRVSLLYVPTSYASTNSQSLLFECLQILEIDEAELKELAASSSGHSELSNQASVAYFNNQVAMLITKLDTVGRIVADCFVSRIVRVQTMEADPS